MSFCTRDGCSIAPAAAAAPEPEKVAAPEVEAEECGGEGGACPINFNRPKRSAAATTSSESASTDASAAAAACPIDSSKNKKQKTEDDGPPAECSGEGGACPISFGKNRKPKATPATEEPKLELLCDDSGCVVKDELPVDPFFGVPIDEVSGELSQKTAREIVQWAHEKFGDGLVLTTSFGIQSALMLHLVTSVVPDIPVIFVDTGYLPKETLEFADQLKKDLKLNLKVYKPLLTPEELEAKYGKLWEDESDEGHRKYGDITKVEPMNRALRELQPKAVLAGLRSEQTSHRKQMTFVNLTKDGHYKVCPILSWSSEQVHEYISSNGLSYHPLKAQGYETVGDAHSSRPVDKSDKDVRATRFHGRAQECGLHMDVSGGSTKQLITNINSGHIKDAKAIKSYVIYTQKSCKYCKAAKEHLQAKETPFVEFTVGDDVNVETVIARVGRLVKTVPQLFLDGEYLGGYEDLVKHLGVPSTQSIPTTQSIATGACRQQ